MAKMEKVAIESECAHLGEAKIREVPRPGPGCEDCLKIGGEWVHLRACLTCGGVRCCDSSPNKHATKHFHKTRHPIMTSCEPGETFVWCYVDEAALSA